MTQPTGVYKIATERLLEESAKSESRFVDLRLQWRDWSGRRVLLDVGGLWDRRLDAFESNGETGAVVKLQPAQYQAAEWFAGWLAAYLGPSPRPKRFDRKWTMFCVGGRRGGKTHFGVLAAATMAIARARRRIMLIARAEEETEELQLALDEFLPEHWHYFRESKMQYTLANYSTIRLISGFKPASLKRGRIDLWVLNEAQEISKAAYVKLRAPIADTGGLGIVLANPPDKEIGQWILDAYDEAKKGKATSELFEFDHEKNPMVDSRALEDMKLDVGEQDYQRDVKGEFIQIGDRVWYAYSPRENIKRVPDLGEVTHEVTRAHLGREFDRVFGIDLQLVPHMAAAGARFFRDGDTAEDPLTFYDDEAIIEGDENDLIDLLESKGHDPERTALIVDASAWWQDAKRTKQPTGKGRGSVDMFRSRGWKWCFRPDSKMERNPHIFERIQATNARLKNAAGRRRMFVSPECQGLMLALRSWENRNGVPYRRSVHAHVSDAISYLIWRFFPRRVKARKLEAETLKRKPNARERDLAKL